VIQAVEEMTNEEIYAALVDLAQIVGPVVSKSRISLQILIYLCCM